MAETPTTTLQVNQFTTSKQDNVAVTINDDRVLVTWDSRRQQGGHYGIYGRWLDLAGTPLGSEFAINQHTRGHQMEPVTTTDALGGTWVAWASNGQDDGFGGIIARHLDGTTGQWQDEFPVSPEGMGHLGETAIASNAQGETLIAWTCTTLDGAHLVARGIGADSQLHAEAFRLGFLDVPRASVPVIAALPDGRFAVSAHVFAADGTPGGVFVQHVDAHGTTGPVHRVSDLGGIEASMASTNEGAIITWLTPSKDGYGLRAQYLDAEAHPIGEPMTIATDPGAWVSGAHVTSGVDGSCTIAWNEDHSGRGKDRIRLQAFDQHGQPTGEPIWLSASLDPGHHLVAASAASPLAISDHGHLVVAFSGHGPGADGSSANAAIIGGSSLPIGQVRTPPVPNLTTDMVAVAPNPPIYDPNFVPIERMPRNRDRGLHDFEGITYTGWTPPDPDIAAGPSHIVEVTNGGIAFFSMTGDVLFEQPIEDSFGFWGEVGATDFVFDPEVIWDPHGDRFIAMACERGNSNDSYFLLAISDDTNPMGTWHKYRINVTSFDTDIDSPNLSVDDQAIYVSADFFSPDTYLVLCIDKNGSYSGGTLNYEQVYLSGSGNQSIGMPVTWDTGTPQYLIQSSEGTSNGVSFSEVRLMAISDPLGSPSISDTYDLNVPTYSYPDHPPQQGSSVRPYLFEPRFWSCIQRGGSLWAVHHVNSSRARVRWYEIDMQGWPGSGQLPVLAQSGEIDGGNGIYTFFPSIAVDGLGNAVITFARSSSNEYISMWEAHREAGDPLDEFQPMTLIQESTSPENSGRWGDYSGASPWPDGNGEIWIAHEWTNGSWRTWISKIEFADPIPQGACCTGTTCAIATEADCSGAYLGDNTDCAGNPCNPTGACCIGTDCTTTTQDDCGGTWLGAGTGCGASTCSGFEFQGITHRIIGTDLVEDDQFTWTVDVYAMLGQGERLDAIAGDANQQKTITTSTSFYQNPFGGPTSQSINPALFENFPDLRYDSFVTIGSLDSSGDPFPENALSDIGIDWSDFEVRRRPGCHRRNLVRDSRRTLRVNPRPSRARTAMKRWVC